MNDILPEQRAPSGDVAAAMRTAAADFLRSLTAEQRIQAQLAFSDDTERRHFYNAPTWQAGLPLAFMEPQQRRLAQRLLATGLSEGGHAIAAQIMGNENVTDAYESFNFGSKLLERYLGNDDYARGRDPLLYFVSIFGSPEDDVWSWRFNGHHLSINYCLVGEDLVGCPMFFGVAPASLDRPGAGKQRLLGVEEDLGHEVLHRLSTAQRSAATISAVAPFDVTQPNRPEVEDGTLMDPDDLFIPNALSPEMLKTVVRAFDDYMATLGWTDAHADQVRFTLDPKGLRAEMMPDDARAALQRLLTCHVERMPPALQQLEYERMLAEFNDLHFAWAGTGRPGEGCYYRIQGPTLLLEFANVQWHANHAHSLWRDIRNDFGRDLLAAHLTTHAHGG